MTTFKDRTVIYKELLHTNKEEALTYYREHLFEDICDFFIQKVKMKQALGEIHEYDYLIMSVGFNVHPLILWIKALQPKEVFFICSPETVSKVDEICHLSNLKHTQCDHTIVSRTNGMDVYQAINDYLSKRRLKQSEQINKVAIDITGGRKNMVSSCTLAANYLGIDLLYIENNGNYLKSEKQFPGREEPIKLEDPLEIFGEKDLVKGIVKFNSEDFEHATEVFREIKLRVLNPRPYEVYENLSLGYFFLEAMEFDKSYEHINYAIQWGKKFDLSGIPFANLQVQLKAIEPLRELHSLQELKILSDYTVYWHLFAYLYEMAKHYLSRKKYDVAALLTYRCIELTVQHLLFKHNIIHSKAKYKHLQPKHLLERFNQISREVYPDFRPSTYLPPKVSLMNGLIILKALEEPMVKNVNIQSINQLVGLRNKSRLAHGFELLKETQVHDFFGKLIGINNYIWNHEKHKLGFQYGFDQFSKAFAFVNIKAN